MMISEVDRTLTKEQIVEQVHAQLIDRGFHIVEVDVARHWGAFLRIADEQADRFIQNYFEGVEPPAEVQSGERSPKILVVAPGARLSWQHHDRRSEFWRVVRGSVGVFISKTNDQPQKPLILEEGKAMHVPQGVRHRLVGLDEWGAVAEIWIHTNPYAPSDEDDIHRHQDDYSR
jgi:mannose-6-phosphate isomerase